MNVLIIDDDINCCDVLEEFIKMLPDCKTFKAYKGIDGLNYIKNNEIDLVFSDIDMPELNGLDLMNLVKTGNYKTEIVLITGKEDLIKSINAIDLGIYDFLIKPVDIYKIKEIIEAIKEKKKIKTGIIKYDIKTVKNLSDIEKINISKNEFFKHDAFNFYLSKKMKIIFKKIDKLQVFPDIPILFEGETGVGKEIAARYAHEKSNRKNYQFIGINCAAVSKEIFESEFFGYVKGAFTGASINGKEGYLKLSENGTLFLDEISEIPYELQSKLLRVLEDREYYKVGSTKKEKVNSRILFASNKDLDYLAKKGILREDLLFRISVCKILIPPLRERTEEIIPLAFYFINDLMNKTSIKATNIEAGVLKKLLNYYWPGNIRELKNVITNLFIFSENKVIKTHDLKLEKKSFIKNTSVINSNDFELPDAPFDIDVFINKIVKKTLEKFNGNKTKTAKFLNLSRIQLYKRFK